MKESVKFLQVFLIPMLLLFLSAVILLVVGQDRQLQINQKRISIERACGFGSQLTLCEKSLGSQYTTYIPTNDKSIEVHLWKSTAEQNADYAVVTKDNRIINFVNLDLSAARSHFERIYPREY